MGSPLWEIIKPLRTEIGEGRENFDENYTEKVKFKSYMLP